MHRVAATILLCGALVCAAPAAFAQEVLPETPPAEGDPNPVSEEEAASQPAEADQAPPASPSTEQFPDDPQQRLELARAAFRRTDYGLLVPLLQPLAVSPSPLDTPADRTEARQLLGVGYFFLAQQTTNPTSRGDLMQAARDVFLELLREKPEHTLDDLTFPASVVELFESVRSANAEELDELLRARESNLPDGQMQTLYIERAATKRIFWLNFLPFGTGQFQNGQYAKGTAFALLQGAGLAVNIASFWVIVANLQNPETGRFEGAAGDQSSNYANALRWRRNLYVGLGSFAGLWVLSAIDGVLNFEEESVRIRTLDAPPPELDVSPGEAGAQVALPLGLAIEWRW